MVRRGWLLVLIVMIAAGSGCNEARGPAESLGFVDKAASADHFVTEWTGTEVTIKSIPAAFISSAYNYDVDWDSDGVFDDVGLTGDASHTYGDNGPHLVRIQGTFPAIRMGVGVDCSNLKAIKQWGSIAWESFSRAFAGCDQLSIDATDVPDLSQVTNMEYAFRNVASFHPSIGTWDVGNVQNMSWMFADTPTFNEDLNGWQTAAVTNMSAMFNGATSFNGDISTWDTRAVTNIAQMFRGASSFNQPINTAVDQSSWDVSAVVDTSYAFAGASSFNQPLDRWSTSEVISMSYMFNNATSFNGNIGTWDTGAVSNMSGMFDGARAFNQPIGLWDTTNVTSMNRMFWNAELFNQDISAWKVGNVGLMIGMFNGATSFDQPLNSWNVGNVTSTAQMFHGATSFNQPIDNWFESDQAAITDISEMFWDATSFNQALNTWSLKNVVTIRGVFHDASSFNQPVGAWDTASVGDMRQAFMGATNFNQPLETWDLSSISDVREMFRGAESFDQDLTTWGQNLAQVSSLDFMFDGARAFNGDVSNWNVSNVEGFRATFRNADSFDQSLASWKVSIATALNNMLDFSGMSPANYDATLIGWSQLGSLSNGVEFGAQGLRFCAGGPARGVLVGGYSWNIVGDMPDCCGNGILDPGELCDDGINDGTAGSCTPDCNFFVTDCYPDEDGDTYGDNLASATPRQETAADTCTGSFSLDNFDCDDGTFAGDCGSNCYPGNPDPDLCDSFDQDCDGMIDEDHVDIGSSCGVGACSDTGVQTCSGGAIVDSCTPGAPAANDASCNNIDDDCDGQTDEDYVASATSCGVGVCQSGGTQSCVSGSVEDSCAVGSPTGSDTTCNGLDENCNGTADENYTSTPTNCGVGACASGGSTSCVSGTEQDSCTPGTPAANDATCDGIDDDCDGQIDEDFVGSATSCGLGACIDSGFTSCVGGVIEDSCAAGTPAANDATCDGIDDDCDTLVDEDYVPTATACGDGACAANGMLTCVAGVEQDSCVSGTPAANDATCDGIDDDCDTQVDEDYASTATSCGVGACQAAGALTCVGGTEVDDCAVGTPASTDTTCDGIDDDCDTQVDEDYVETATSCGQGACEGTGTLSCVSGVEEDSCASGPAGSTDASCDGVDDDCDTEFDEDYPGGISNCGVGACASTGVLTCESGSVNDSCAPGTPAANDATCDGIDDDCDGQIDEDYVSTATSCGVGACGASGTLSCVAGAEQDSCTPGTAAANDATCDGIDDDCDGTSDEDYTQTATSCGVGACGASGTLSCVAGAEQDSCTPGTAAANDATCDGIDDDCDGTSDEDYTQTATSCGVGACGASGTLSCVAGAEQDSCTPGTAAANDATCDLLDDDCDGSTDEDAVSCFTCGVPADCPTLTNDCKEYTCPSGVCVLGDKTAGSVCDDSAFCTATDTCDGSGSCNGTGSPCSGGTPYCEEDTTECVECRTSADCPASANECQVAVCTTGTCGLADKTVGTTCTSDNNACNGQEQCLDDGGTISCLASGVNPCDQSGDNPTCVDDGNDSNSCIGSCGDGRIGVGETCDRGGLNTDDANAGGCSTSCELNTGWRCPGGTPTCTNPEPICGDGIVIGTREACDEGPSNGSSDCGCTASCVYVAQGASCDDDLYCNGVDTCNGSGTCGQHSGSPCSLGAAACREDSDTCDECLSSAQCDNGQACDGMETCDIALGLCTDGPDITCSGDFVCDDTDGSCGCPTGQAETGPEICEPIECTFDADCDDGNVCNGIETCDTETSQCVGGAPLGCSNGLACDGLETCDPEFGCEVGNVVNCSSGFECIEPAGTCESKCGNGTIDQGEACDDGAGNSDTNPDACRTNCQSASCGDGVQDSGEQCDDDNQQVGDGCSANCMIEECVTVADCDAVTECQTAACTDGSCFYNDKSQGTPCSDDGIFCSGGERCDGAGTCVSSGSPCGNPSAPLCDEGLASCVACLDSTDCDDGVFCNGEELCDGTGACAPGTPVSCTTGFVCDPIEDACVTLCGNGICDTVETVVSCAEDCSTGGTDSDGDGVPDAKELQLGTDPELTDSDGDSVPDGVEIGDVANPRNTDGDGLIDARDEDDDDDGILTLLEDVDDDGDLFDEDGDNDGVPNFRDADDDGDGVPTRIEAFGTKPSSVVIKALPDGLLDSDEDGIPNYLDKDDDGDTILTASEVQGNGNAWDLDTDQDGVPNYVDKDDDGDTLLTADEVNEPSGPDFDEDGIANYLDEDDDNDGVLTADEVTIYTSKPYDSDTDDDNLLDGDEVALGTSLIDDDTDDDGLLDGEELEFNADPLNPDTDDDGLLDGDEIKVYQTNVRNPDTDNDGLADGAEVFTHRTDPSNADSDNDGFSDGEEIEFGSDANNDASVPIPSDAAGGAGAGGCTSFGGTPWEPALALIGLVALAVVRRRRRC